MPSNRRCCKICMSDHLRIYGGKWGNKFKQWRDEHGLLWNGNVCGLCNRIRVRLNKQNKLKEGNGEPTN